MSEIDPAKLHAARAAAALVRSGMVVGLGSGTTASVTVRELATRVRSEGLDIVGVPTSAATAELARSLGIPLRDLDDVDSLDLNLDGADEIDTKFAMIKGRGGALLREKIVASAARFRVAIVTAAKRIERLGRTMPLPVEVSRFGLKHTDERLRAVCSSTSVRKKEDGTLFITDGGNAIIDCRFSEIDDPSDLDCRLHGLAGVLATGLFIGLCDLVIVGHADRAETIPNETARTGST
jgi:ribose 5-phosphate isomerase A